MAEPKPLFKSKFRIINSYLQEWPQALVRSGWNRTNFLPIPLQKLNLLPHPPSQQKKYFWDGTNEPGGKWVR